MISFAEISTFLIASVILAFTPGPDNIFVIVTSLGQGFKTALKFIFGLALGIVLHTFLIIIGVSALISQSTYGLSVLKYFAIFYLLYLAVKTFQHRHDPININSQNKVENYFLRGFIMNVSNPKVLLFFLAFFPQFAHFEEAGYPLRLAFLGALFILVTLVVFSLIAWFAARGRNEVIENPTYAYSINVLAIIVFVSVSLLLFMH